MLFSVLNKKCGLICAFRKESSACVLSASAITALCKVRCHSFIIDMAVPSAHTVINKIRDTISKEGGLCSERSFEKGIAGGGRRPSIDLCSCIMRLSNGLKK